jgi:parallel beta-helix repeat protein
MARVNLLAVLVVTILLSSLSFAATYYVDALYGKDTNSGTSTSSPWKTIAKVNAFTFKPGDVILFKRGAAWKETLTVKQNGTSTASIRFDAYGSGSLPVFDGSMSRSYGIYASTKSYVQIRNIKVQNTTHGAVYITDSKYISVQNCEMYITGRAGVFIQRSSYCYISGNKMSTPDTYYNVQTDGVYAQRNTNNTYDGNHIVISNRHADQHCDAIQFYNETNGMVKNNYVEQNNTKMGNAQGIYCSENHGLTKIFNNVAYGMYSTAGMIKFENASTTGKVEIIGNTAFGGKMGLIRTNDPYVIFRNNIVVTTGSNPPVWFIKTVANKSNVSNNLYKNSTTGSGLVMQGSTIYTISKWKGLGYDASSIEADPKFTSRSSKDFTLLSGSPAINKGVDLSSPYNVDRIGTKRPYSLRSDIGAYEMKLTAKLNEEVLGEEEFTTELPEVFELTQNYPNPFNPSTTIRYSIPEAANVNLKVYDITGSEVAVLLNDFQNAGQHEVSFNAQNLASGTYIYVLTAKDFVETKKMILLK